MKHPWYILPIFTTVIFLSSFFCIYGQRTCGTDQHYANAIKKDPTIEQHRQAIEKRLQLYLKEDYLKSSTTITIPVVFQVIHNGDAVGSNENLSEARIMAQLAQLNQDYARLNSDAANTPTAFNPVASNTMIQFCLASVDPNGQATNGIVRTNLNLNQNACWNSDFIDQNIVIGRTWNTAQYLNIFTVQKLNDDDCQDELLGYATFPGGNPVYDVVVQTYSTIGSLNLPHPAGGDYGYGRTVSHEVGHWLNLDHIWGRTRSCSGDDGVADTPPQYDSNYGCPMFPKTDQCTSSGHGVMFMNYMDYVDDQCMNMFTTGQGARMRAAIQASRPQLIGHTRCAAGDCPPTLAINQDPISSGSYKAQSVITAQGVVRNNAIVTLQANSHIALQPIFEILLGSVLNAQISNCD